MNDAISDDTASEQACASRDLVGGIAAILGCSAQAFSDGEGLPLGLTGASELLTLWGSLKSDASRQAVLQLIRAVVEADDG